MTSPGAQTLDIASAIRSASEHHQAGRLADAERLCVAVLEARPDHPDALHLLGVLSMQSGRHPAAVELIGRAVAQRPRDAAILCDLGVAYRAAGRPGDAERALLAALALAPAQAMTHAELAAALRDLGRLGEAEASLTRAAELQPEAAGLQFERGNVLKVLGRLEASRAAYARALALQPAFPQAHNNLGIVLAELGRFVEAERSYRLAIAMRPAHARAWHNLGNLLRELGRHEEAEDCYRRALDVAPDEAETHAHLGNALLDLGKLEEGERSHRRALALDPGNPRARSNLLLFLNYLPGRAAASILEEHRGYGALFPRARPSVPFPDLRAQERRLRVGYVSGDFRAHSVAAFFKPVLEQHDRTRFEVTCYYNFPRADDVTESLRALADRWREVHSLGDDALEALIREDRIDILVDLSGHTAYHRLPVFARRPAPVQVSYLGYPGPSGLEAMDYRITDALADPPGVADAGYTERLVRLPRPMWCFQPPDRRAPPVARRARGAGVLFGSFNYYAKLNSGVIETWARLLRRLPDSRLAVTRMPGLRTAAALRAQFASLGIEPHRLELCGVLSREKLRQLWASVDIGLDPFPYAGTTTTCEALWAGIPVVTLAGETTAARSGASLMTAVGLQDLVADSVESYIAVAERLAIDATRLGALQRDLRERMTASALMDAQGLTRCLEEVYVQIWSGSPA